MAGLRPETVSVFINTLTNTDEIRRVIEQTGPRLLFYEKKFEDQSNQLAQLQPEVLICIDQSGSKAKSMEQWIASVSEKSIIDATSRDTSTIIIPTDAVR